MPVISLERIDQEQQAHIVRSGDYFSLWIGSNYKNLGQFEKTSDWFAEAVLAIRNLPSVVLFANNSNSTVEK